jgi:hypothetical protein
MRAATRSVNQMDTPLELLCFWGARWRQGPVDAVPDEGLDPDG